MAEKRWRSVGTWSALALASWLAGVDAKASTLVPQTPIPGDCIPQFVQPLPIIGTGYNAALPPVDAAAHPFLTITMKETSRQVLPSPFTPTDPSCPAVDPQQTRVWAYETRDSITGRVLGPAFWPAVTIEARRFLPTIVKYVNQLPRFDPANPYGPGLVQGLMTIDQTLHWADPQNLMCNMGSDDPACLLPFVGAPPAVVHLHGGEVPSFFDGGPEQWFTPDGQRGAGYASLLPAGPNAAIYAYPNSQLPGTIWFHDHALGATRTNVYSGMAAFYLIHDPKLEPAALPSGAYELDFAIQDRQFDTNGQLFFADGSGANADVTNLNGPPPNPDVHPFWIPEFIGDVLVVNGTPWPFVDVEPRRYRLRIIEGSNARFYNLAFGGAPVFQIGSDGAYLDAPVPVDTVFIAPGERADLVVDFSRLAGQSITVTNDAPVPFPEGLVPGVDQPGMANVMQFRVTLPLRGSDSSCDPAAGGCKKPKIAKTERLTDGVGHLAPGIKIDRVRQLVLKEVMGGDGPLEVLVNNTKWDGTRSPSVASFQNGVTELPRVGATELWEIVNLTGDAHPMHTHLMQFQILNRQAFDGYDAAWDAAFGTGPVPLPPECTPGAFCPGYGPPLPYLTPNADGAIGGNPAVGPFLSGAPRPPRPEESGFKDTAKSFPGEVLRIVVRAAPTYAPAHATHPGKNLYPFDPTAGPGYVWHCHIVDHEDNEMMRPMKIAR